MSARRRLPVPGPRALAFAFVVLGVVALGLSLGRARPYDRLTEDERDYLYAAANLARSGTLSFAPPGSGEPTADAYREPLFPILLAAGWWSAGLTPPASATEVEAIFSQAPLYRSIRWLQLGFLTLAAVASGWAAWQLAGAKAGAAAFLFVSASPALHERSVMVMTEVAAAAAIAALAAALVAAARGRVGGAWTAMAIVALLPLLRAEALLLLPLAGLAVGWYPSSAQAKNRERRLRAAFAAFLLAALPSAGWMVRNQWRLGMAALSDRSGLALAVRARLDAEVARVGIGPALLVWTPLDSAQAKAKELAPSSTLADYRWTGAGNFFTRTITEWRRERAASGGDALAVDAAYRRDAWRRFRSHPGAHLQATLAVAWRALFAERSPPWCEPFDFRFELGLLLLAAVGIFAGRAVGRRDAPRFAFLLPFLLLFSFHALATEFLPRYAVPLLPGAWVAVAVLLLGAEAPRMGVSPAED